MQAHAHGGRAVLGGAADALRLPGVAVVRRAQAAASLVAAGDERASTAAWLLLRALLVADPEWMGGKGRLAGRRRCGRRCSRAARAADAGHARARRGRAAHARPRAASLSDFLKAPPPRALAPLLKHVVAALLPPNTELLRACRENAASLMTAPPFRAAFVLFRARLYELLDALPTSELRAAKALLNVVMPMVVGDIVDPSNTQSATCTCLATMLAADDGLLAAEHDDAGLEPPRTGLAPEAEAACEWLGELRGGAGHGGGARAQLGGASSAPSSTSRRPTSASSCSANSAPPPPRRPRPSRSRRLFSPSGGDKGGDRASALSNVCAALLASLQQLAARPSRSAIKPELADALVGVLSPCLLDADAAVRRGAAHCAGLLGQLLGDGYAKTFFGICEGLIPSAPDAPPSKDRKASDESRAAHALALCWLQSAAGGLPPPRGSRRRRTSCGARGERHAGGVRVGDARAAATAEAAGADFALRRRLHRPRVEPAHLEPAPTPARRRSAASPPPSSPPSARRPRRRRSARRAARPPAASLRSS